MLLENVGKNSKKGIPRNFVLNNHRQVQEKSGIFIHSRPRHKNNLCETSKNLKQSPVSESVHRPLFSVHLNVEVMRSTEIGLPEAKCVSADFASFFFLDRGECVRCGTEFVLSVFAPRKKGIYTRRSPDWNGRWNMIFNATFMTLGCNILVFECAYMMYMLQLVVVSVLSILTTTLKWVKTTNQMLCVYIYIYLRAGQTTMSYRKLIEKRHSIMNCSIVEISHS